MPCRNLIYGSFFTKNPQNCLCLKFCTVFISVSHVSQYTHFFVFRVSLVGSSIFRMVQLLDDFYHCCTWTEAKPLLKKLTGWMMHSRLEPMKSAARSLRRNEEEILAYSANRISNAFAEGMNSLIQKAERTARGFRTYEGFRIMIYLALGKLQLAYPRPFPC